jgi:DNA adenine methylase
VSRPSGFDAFRWYPETIVNRLREIGRHADRIDFRETDGMQLLEELLANRGYGPACAKHSAAGRSEASGADLPACVRQHTQAGVIFVDPPYTAGGKRAGRRLYAHNEIDHPRLFEMLADSGTDFLMTYDRTSEIVSLSQKYGFHAVGVTMKNTHHALIPELIITPKPVFVH